LNDHLARQSPSADDFCVRLELPSGTVTFLFTDVEGSTTLLNELGTERYADALVGHRAVIREACTANGGVEVDTQGDAFFFAFPTAPGALAAASDFTKRLAATGPIRVRVGIHTGTPFIGDEGYIGHDVHRAARIAAAGHGGQVLLSQATRELVERRDLRDLGGQRLKDFDEPVRLYQFGQIEFPPLKTLNNTNLPIPGSSFLGREQELADVTSLLRNGGGRLVTLTGPGGSGKTRLAIEAAADVVGDYRDGVFWIGLASLREPALVVETIARTLGATDGLAEQITDRKLLLLLDNFEHLIDAAVELSALLAACRNVRMLVTSRELLRLQGEVEYQVPPLSPSEAEELFCARSYLQRDDEIADLCRRLDDLPLAVELAAARTAVLTPAQIRDRLSQRLDLFRGGRDADPRQQTLRATIEWSYDLLTEPDRRLFARLSVFAGGCTLDAAEEIVQAEVEGLQSLVDKSLVRRSRGRFWMLDTIGELARERFDASGESEAIGRRHAEWFLAEAERAEPFLKGAEQPAWLQRLEDDHDNLRKSLDWLFDHGETELAARLAGALWLFWYMHGHVSEARRWLRRALDAGSDEPSETRATLLDGAGYLAAEQYDDEAIGLLEASLSCAKEVGATSAAAIAAAHLCGVRAEVGGGGSNFRAALAAGDEAVAFARQAGDDYALAVALNNLGQTHALRGDTERATAYLEESLALRRRIGDMSRIALSLTNVAYMMLGRGDIGRAAALYSEAAEIATAIGDKRHVCFAFGGLASVAYRQRRWEDAETHARASLRLAKELGSKLSMVEAIFCIAGIAATTGDAARTARLAAAADLYHSPLAPDGMALDDEIRANIERAKAASELETWQQAWAAGRAMSLDEAADHALSVSVIPSTGR
jgi:predicted ATPase/class 3 adenylate cyclase